ncbi:MAG: hypothetical protein IJ678_08425, partial [Kiritimatiellae bacterium]|nr:hypothetical protein [Kiritimatiellia bacterium]
MNYRPTTTKAIIDQIARLRGWDPAAAAIPQSECERIVQLANAALLRAWSFAPWPQLLLVRRVTYRPEWLPGEYCQEGEQVFCGGGYWEAKCDTTEAPGAPGGDWVRCEAWMLPSIDYNAWGIDEIDLAAGVYAVNPETRADALPLPARRTARGCSVATRG